MNFSPKDPSATKERSNKISVEDQSQYSNNDLELFENFSVPVS